MKRKVGETRIERASLEKRARPRVAGRLGGRLGGRSGGRLGGLGRDGERGEEESRRETAQTIRI
jgi:hypothetical protein